MYRCFSCSNLNVVSTIWSHKLYFLHLPTKQTIAPKTSIIDRFSISAISVRFVLTAIYISEYHRYGPLFRSASIPIYWPSTCLDIFSETSATKWIKYKSDNKLRCNKWLLLCYVFYCHFLSDEVDLRTSK